LWRDHVAIKDITVDQAWFEEQVKCYKAMEPRYRIYAETLQNVLGAVAKKYAPQAVVQTRSKSLASFAEKIIRKRDKFDDPCHQFTDLCGGRVVTHTQDEVDAVCAFIKKNFDIDWNDSVSIEQRLNPTEFGYRSVHYVVTLRPGTFSVGEGEVIIPDDVRDLKAEIQVRTLLEHAWADFSHDRSYKSAFKVPAKWERELVRLAAMLEEADASFTHIDTGLREYASSYGAYMEPEKISEEIERLKLVAELDPQNAALIDRVGKLFMTLGEWEQAVDILSSAAGSGCQPLLKDLGVALHMFNRHKPGSLGYRRGQRYLEIASSPPYVDADVLLKLADTWKGIDEVKVRELYRAAFEIDPRDPFVLCNFLEYEIEYRRDSTVLQLMPPMIEAAIERCREHIDVGMSLPWAFYTAGMFYLLLKKPYASLAAYAKAIDLSSADWMLDKSLQGIKRLAVIRDELPGYEWVERLLLLACASAGKQRSHKALQQIKKLTRRHKSISGPVVIVAGGCDARIDKRLGDYRQLLIEAFKDYRGTIISGGTTAGISGLVGDVQERYKRDIATIGYVPRLTAVDATIDGRYSEIRKTDGSGFSPLEVVDYWSDLIASGIAPSNVKLIGIEGGQVSAAEYRIALALGASVGIVEESGYEAAKLLSDGDWNSSANLLRLTEDAFIMQAFVGPGLSQLVPNTRETIARMIHEEYRESQRKDQRDKLDQEPNMADWDALRTDLRESNLEQADHIKAKLRGIKYSMHEVGKENIKRTELPQLTDGQIELLAEMEHARWIVERLRAGWTYGPEKDLDRKVSPYLVPWRKLPDNVRKWDRDTVCKIPQFLAEVGIEIRRDEHSPHKQRNAGGR
jgi:ppGpp synthetase/RelA/SpoT-type nucleotidyltranferase